MFLPRRQVVFLLKKTFLSTKCYLLYRINPQIKLYLPTLMQIFRKPKYYFHKIYYNFLVIEYDFFIIAYFYCSEEKGLKKRLERPVISHGHAK